MLINMCDTIPHHLPYPRCHGQSHSLYVIKYSIASNGHTIYTLSIYGQRCWLMLVTRATRFCKRAKHRISTSTSTHIASILYVWMYLENLHIYYLRANHFYFTIFSTRGILSVLLVPFIFTPSLHRNTTAPYTKPTLQLLFPHLEKKIRNEFCHPELLPRPFIWNGQWPAVMPTVWLFAWFIRTACGQFSNPSHYDGLIFILAFLFSAEEHLCSHIYTYFPSVCRSLFSIQNNYLVYRNEPSFRSFINEPKRATCAIWNVAQKKWEKLQIARQKRHISKCYSCQVGSQPESNETQICNKIFHSTVN